MGPIEFRGKYLTLVEYLQLLQAGIISKSEIREMLKLPTEKNR